MKNVFLTILLLTSCSLPTPRKDHIFNSTVARVFVKTDKSENYGTAMPIRCTDSTVYFLTCRHVIKRDNIITISLSLFHNACPYGVIENAKVWAECDYMDLAILEAPKTLPVIKCLMSNEDLWTTQDIVSISCPLGEDPVFSKGIVTIQNKYYVTSASIAPGSSGGGIFDANTGELIGISTAILSYDNEKYLFGSINIFIPMPYISKWLKEKGLP